MKAKKKRISSVLLNLNNKPRNPSHEPLVYSLRMNKTMKEISLLHLQLLLRLHLQLPNLLRGDSVKQQKMSTVWARTTLHTRTSTCENPFGFFLGH